MRVAIVHYWLVEGGEGLGFPLKPVQPLLASGQIGRQHLEVQVRGAREIPPRVGGYEAHAAVAVNGIDDKPFSAVLGVSRLKVLENSALIIGADQLAVLDGQVLGKPGSHQKAVEQLLAASGKSVTFLTAVCMLDPVTRKRYEHTDETIVHFREFDRRLAEAYLRLDEPYDCAGSFKLEGAGFLLFESVKTDDPTALIGLPMIWISDRLLELGYLLP